MLEPAGNRMTAARRTRSGGSTAAETGAQARLNTFPRPRAMTIGSSDGWSAPPACAVFGCTTCGAPLLRSCWPGREPPCRDGDSWTFTNQRHDEHLQRCHAGIVARSGGAGGGLAVRRTVRSCSSPARLDSADAPHTRVHICELRRKLPRR